MTDGSHSPFQLVTQSLVFADLFPDPAPLEHISRCNGHVLVTLGILRFSMTQYSLAPS